MKCRRPRSWASSRLHQPRVPGTMGPAKFRGTGRLPECQTMVNDHDPDLTRSRSPRLGPGYRTASDLQRRYPEPRALDNSYQPRGKFVRKCSIRPYQCPWSGVIDSPVGGVVPTAWVVIAIRRNWIRWTHLSPRLQRLEPPQLTPNSGSPSVPRAERTHRFANRIRQEWSTGGSIRLLPIRLGDFQKCS